MEFWEYNTIYATAKKDPEVKQFDTPTQFYKENIEEGMRKHPNPWDGTGHFTPQASFVWRMAIEYEWFRQDCPYYKVFPSIIDALLGVKLTVPANYFGTRMPALCVRLPKKEPEPFVLRSLLMFMDRHRWFAGNAPATVIVKYLNEDLRRSATSFAFDFSQTPPEMTAQDCLDELLKYQQTSQFGELGRKLIEHSWHLAMAVSLIDHSPEMVRPDVLNADRARYEKAVKANDKGMVDRLIDRAKRRGKHGWIVGADYERCPHYRRPHLGLRWTGKGRVIPKIVPVKGCVVNRQKLTKVPTGYIIDGKEVEE